MQLADFHFELPLELIARYPLAKRSESRLMCLAKQSNNLIHNQFFSVLDLIQEGDLLVLNETKVIPARLFGQKVTGGQVELLVERVLDQHRIIAQVRASKSPKVGDLIYMRQADGTKSTSPITLEVLNRQEQFYELKYQGTDCSILDLIEKLGKIPLPHYMHRQAEESDKERYQTVYAKHKGSVAAPTAGFHFDEALLQKLRDKKVSFGYLTLHIGAGTFAPVRVDDIREHKMHSEYIEVSAELCDLIVKTKAAGKRVISVGTTSLRALETASQSGEIKPFYGDTNIFIYPGYQFNCADALITNLHLPSSTLLMLVCAFAGKEKVLHAYNEAVKRGYRFYSYGDAMWMERDA